MPGQRRFPAILYASSVGTRNIRTSLHIGTLPGREVCILKRQSGRNCRLTSAESRVKRGQFLKENADTPTVSDDMMDQQEERIPFRGKTEQGNTPQRPPHEIEGLGSISHEMLLKSDFAFVFRQPLKIHFC